MTIHIKEAMERFDNDAGIYIDLVDTFLEVGATDIAGISASLNAGDNKQVLHLAHKLKGAALTLGADDLSREAAAIESVLRAEITADVSASVAALVPLYRDTVTELERTRDDLRKQS